MIESPSQVRRLSLTLPVRPDCGAGQVPPRLAQLFFAR